MSRATTSEIPYTGIWHVSIGLKHFNYTCATSVWGGVGVAASPGTLHIQTPTNPYIEDPPFSHTNTQMQTHVERARTHAHTHRSSYNDIQLEAVKLQEELDLMRVQLDAARKEAEAQRKRAAAIEVRWGCVRDCVLFLCAATVMSHTHTHTHTQATAATVMSATPFGGCGRGLQARLHTGGAAMDDTDREVDALLQQLQVRQREQLCDIVGFLILSWMCSCAELSHGVVGCGGAANCR